jgi:hypothetical protein
VFALALLQSAPRDAVLFVGGDNDTYPLWYAQRVEGVRPDVVIVTLPLLSADWYGREIARRTGWRWSDDEAIPGARWRNEQRGAAIARAARRMGRPVAASPTLTARERALLGGDWVLRGPLFESRSAEVGAPGRASIDVAAARGWVARPPWERANGHVPTDDVVATMLGLLDCPRLASPRPVPAVDLDSLEVKCNLR